MERRDFLKRLGIGIAGAVVAPLGDAKADQSHIWTPRPKGRSMVGYTGPWFKKIEPVTLTPAALGTAQYSGQIPVSSPAARPNMKWARVSNIIVPNYEGSSEAMAQDRALKEMFNEKHISMAAQQLELADETRKWVRTGMDRADALAYAAFMLEERRRSVRDREAG